MSLARCAEFAATAAWADLSPALSLRTRLIVLDTLACAVAAKRLGALEAFTAHVAGNTSEAEATVWATGTGAPLADAALANAALSHYLDWDDGHGGASVHGGATIVPVALVCGEAVGATGREVLVAVAAGYAVAVAVGRPLVGGIERHGLHPPAIAGAFGAAAAAGRLLALDAPALHRALTLAACLVPVAPFQAFTSGATIKTLYAGWPAFVGIAAARLAQAGMGGPDDVLSSPADGLGRFLLHAPVEADVPNLAEMEAAAFKRFPACRAVHPALTALLTLLPIDPASVASVIVETYSFAADLSRDADDTTPIGATASIPYCLASLLVDGDLRASAFAPPALDDPARRRLAGCVQVRTAAPDALAPRRTRVAITLVNGSGRSALVEDGAWGVHAPATEHEVRAKFRQIVGPGSGVEAAVDALEDAGKLVAVVGAVADTMRRA